MREPSTAEVLPVPVPVNGRTYFWTAQAGLDPAVVGDVEHWIRRRARGYASAARMRGLDLDDLLQEGRAGAIRAAQSFDPGAGSTFLNYADSWIRQAMIGALNDSHAVYMPRRHRDQALRSGTLPGVVCLDAPVPDHEATLLDLQPCEQPTPLETAEQAETLRTLHGAIQRLSSLHRTILIHRYGLDGPEESLETIAQLLGYGRETIRRNLLHAEAQLRALLRETPMEPMKPAARSAAKASPFGRQLTVQGMIRDQKRHERAAADNEKERQKTLKEATRGPSLFADGEV